MEEKLLANRIGQPDIHRAALSGYSGAYSLGVGNEPGHPGPVLRLSVPFGAQAPFPDWVDVDGEKVRLVVRRDFKVPTPLRGSNGST